MVFNQFQISWRCFSVQHRYKEWLKQWCYHNLPASSTQPARFLQTFRVVLFGIQRKHGVMCNIPTERATEKKRVKEAVQRLNEVPSVSHIPVLIAAGSRLRGFVTRLCECCKNWSDESVLSTRALWFCWFRQEECYFCFFPLSVASIKHILEQVLKIASKAVSDVTKYKHAIWNKLLMCSNQVQIKEVCPIRCQS